MRRCLRASIGWLDVTIQTRIDDADVAMFAASGDPAAELAAAILPHYLDVYERTTGVRACAVRDPLAVAVAARPELVGTRTLPLRVETTGRFTRRMTVADQRGARAVQDDPDAPTTEVASAVDVEAFLELLRDRLTSG